jgi:hypothetical protein
MDDPSEEQVDMQENTGDAATAVSPPPRQFASLESTAVPDTVTREDGSVQTGTILVVHAPGAPVPAQMRHTCGPTCGRRRTP